jgi:ribosome-associated protein
MSDEFESSLEVYVKAALGRKAFDIAILDVRQLTSVADAFILCSGRSNRQVTAIADFIVTDLKRRNLRPLHVEGKKEGHWVLLDYGHVIIHVFYEPVRVFYDLEGLWSDACRIPTKSLADERVAAPDARHFGDDIIEEVID